MGWIGRARRRRPAGGTGASGPGNGRVGALVGWGSQGRHRADAAQRVSSDEIGIQLALAPGAQGARSSVPPQVQIVPPPSGDLESRSFRGQNKRGVPSAVVAALVLLALIAGFVIGLAVGRM